MWNGEISVKVASELPTISDRVHPIKNRGLTVAFKTTRRPRPDIIKKPRSLFRAILKARR
jgi:hypothetical protein